MSFQHTSTGFIRQEALTYSIYCSKISTVGIPLSHEAQPNKWHAIRLELRGNSCNQRQENNGPLHLRTKPNPILRNEFPRLREGIRSFTRQTSGSQRDEKAKIGSNGQADLVRGRRCKSGLSLKRKGLKPLRSRGIAAACSFSEAVSLGIFCN